MRWLVLLSALVVGCGGHENEDADGGTDAGVCPAAMPAPGAKCVGTLTCSYAGACGQVRPKCVDGHWDTSDGACPPPPPPPPKCPAAPPISGQPCTTRMTCTYGCECGRGTWATCNGGSWHVDPYCSEFFTMVGEECTASGKCDCLCTIDAFDEGTVSPSPVCMSDECGSPDEVCAWGNGLCVMVTPKKLLCVRDAHSTRPVQHRWVVQASMRACRTVRVSRWEKEQATAWAVVAPTRTARRAIVVRSRTGGAYVRSSRIRRRSESDATTSHTPRAATAR